MALSVEKKREGSLEIFKKIFLAIKLSVDDYILSSISWFFVFFFFVLTETQNLIKYIRDLNFRFIKYVGDNLRLNKTCKK